MYIQVRLLNGFHQKLTYKVPEGWDLSTLEGAIVSVPLQKRVEYAYIEKIQEHLDYTPAFTIRTALSLDKFPQDPLYLKYINYLSNYYALDYCYFLKRLKQFLKDKEYQEEHTKNNITEPNKPIILTKDQESIVQSLESVVNQNNYFAALIHGVTGSGKTEIYKKIIIQAYKQNKSSLLLLPEVSLALQFYNKLKNELDSSYLIYNFHSATSVKEKKALWSSLLKQQPIIVIGVHLPLLLPIKNLGLIIIDEEHDTGYQEKKHPKINTKEAALLRAKTYNIPIILGSATPSISSLYQVKQKKWLYFQLKERFSGNFPTVKIINLTSEKRQKSKHFFISRELEQAIKSKLELKEQIIIFLNRRGYSFFIQCKDCGHIAVCKNCSVSLTLHTHNSQEISLLRCHYCDYSITCPTKCLDSICNAPEKSLIKKGMGTQQVVSILEKIFPAARIARADLDSTINKKHWQKTMSDFESGNLDILVGTQTITKGYHFPKVTLVGVLWADLNLHFPVYNAAEVTLQQLIQVAGRAGRQTQKSEVIIQTLINHPIYSYLNEAEYHLFYDYEIEKRTLVGYPPCTRLAELELKHQDAAVVDQEVDALADQLLDIINKHSLPIKLLGPTQPPIHMVKKSHIRKIYLKSATVHHILELYKSIHIKQFKSSLFLVQNPL